MFWLQNICEIPFWALYSILGSLYCTKCDPQMSMNPEAKHLKWLAQWEAAHKTLPHNQTHTHTHTRWQASCLKSLGSNHSWMLSSAVCCFVVHVAKRPSSSQRLREKTNPEREWDMVEGRKLWVFKSQSLMLLWTKVLCLWRQNVEHKVSREDGEQDDSEHTESAPHTHSGWV